MSAQPQAPTGSRPQAGRSWPPALQPGSAGRILVVEDNGVNQLVAEAVVSRLGFEVTSVTNGAEAVEAVAGGGYSAVLMDCHMPIMDGFTATRAIRRREAGGDRTPIIAMTAGSLTEDRERCLDAGMDDYLCKPINGPALQAVLARWAVGERSQPASPPVASDGDRRSAAPHGRPGLAVLDESRLVDLEHLPAPDGSSLLAAIVRTFVRKSPEQLSKLRRAARSQDVDSLTGVAHALRGSAGTLGAERVAELCRRIEVGTQPTATPETMLDELDHELLRAHGALTSYLARPDELPVSRSEITPA